MIGRVVSVKNLKTATVVLETTKKHPLYRKSFLSTKKYLVDDPIGVKLGDIVDFAKCAPVSKRKHWRISKVLGSDEVALGTEHMQKKAQEAIKEVLPEQEEINAQEPVTSKENKKEIKNRKGEKLATKP